MIDVSVVGATGFTGTELVRILLSHPGANIKHITAGREKEERKSISLISPSLKEFDLPLESFDDETIKKINTTSDVVFLCLPNGQAHKIADKFSAKIIDLSADFRLKDLKLYHSVYGFSHENEQLLNKAVYGLPEIFRTEISKAEIVANPGCYPTAFILALYPLFKNFEISSIFVDAKSGVTGAGRKLRSDLAFSHISENIQVYSSFEHRHIPEMIQIFSDYSFEFGFAAQLIPAKRGILETIWITLKDAISEKDLQKAYSNYSSEFFVDVDNSKLPDISSVVGTNICRLGFRLSSSGRTVLVVSVIDNLIKGAAGQAIQNMNLMFGNDETLGLELIPHII